MTTPRKSTSNSLIKGNDTFLGTLTIYNWKSPVSFASAQDYTCIASNALGKSQAKIVARKLRNPETPYNVRAVEIEHDSIVLAWDIVHSDSGYWHYAKVIYKRLSDGPPLEEHCGLNKGTCHISGLSENSFYQAVVQTKAFRSENTSTSSELLVKTAVNPALIPYDRNLYVESQVQYRQAGRLAMSVSPYPLPLVANITYKDEYDVETKTVELSVIEEGKYWIGSGHTELQVQLCLESDPSVCGRKVTKRPPNIYKYFDKQGNAILIAIMVSLCALPLLIGGVIFLWKKYKTNSSAGVQENPH